MLSEHKDESESESSNDDDDDDLNETKRYYEDPEEGIGESGSKPSSPKAVNTTLLPYRRVPEIQPVPSQTPHPETPCQPNPGAPRARVPAVSVPAKLLLPNYNFRP